MMYTEPVNQRLSQRIAITNAEPTAENYAKTENVSLCSSFRLQSSALSSNFSPLQIIWVQDFPEVDQSKLKDKSDSTESSRNTTHTDFSAGFFSFMGGGTSLPEKCENKSFVAIEENFDFSASASVQPVLSIAGKWSQGELPYAGGFTSLAKAMKNFGVCHKGAWRIEYIVRIFSSFFLPLACSTSTDLILFLVRIYRLPYHCRAPRSSSRTSTLLLWASHLSN